MCDLCGPGPCSHGLGSSKPFSSRAAAARALHCRKAEVVRTEVPGKPGTFRDVAVYSHKPQPGYYDGEACRAVGCPNRKACAFAKAHANVVSSKELELVAAK